jgi:SsrA-binding protein
MSPSPKGPRPVASNRRARHDYEILDVVEAGIALVGTEVKSLRDGKIQLKDSYARLESGELWLVGVHVSPYEQADGFGGHDPERPRKLLLHRDEIDDLGSRTQREALSLIPLSVYFKDGKAKVELALARGRKQHDKRAAMAERDANRDIDRAMHTRGGGEREGRGTRGRPSE